MNKLETPREAKSLCLKARDKIQDRYDDNEAMSELLNQLNDMGRLVAIEGVNPLLLGEISKYANRVQLILKGRCFVQHQQEGFRSTLEDFPEVEVVGTRSTSYMVTENYLHYGVRVPFADFITADFFPQLKEDAANPEKKGIMATDICDAISLNFRSSDTPLPQSLEHQYANTDLMRKQHVWFSADSSEELMRRARSTPNGQHAQRKKALGLFWRLDQLYGEILAQEEKANQALPQKSVHFIASVQGSRKITNQERANLALADTNVSPILPHQTLPVVNKNLPLILKSCKTTPLGRQQLLSVAQALGLEL